MPIPKTWDIASPRMKLSNPGSTLKPLHLFSSLAGLGAGAGAGTGIAAGAGAAGGILGMPWSVVVPILLSVFGGLFEKEEDPLEEAMALKRNMGTLGIQPPYQNPYLPQMSEAALKAVLGRLQQTSGWGWPADRQPPNTDWIMQMLATAPTGTGGTRRRIPA